MYQITTRTGRVVHTQITTLNEAMLKIRMLEMDTKRANIYSPGYYRIEKQAEQSEETMCSRMADDFVTRCHKVENKDETGDRLCKA